MINGRSLFNSLHDRQKKKPKKNKEIKTYRLTGPPTNIEQYFDWTVVDLVLVVDIESWKLPLEANNIILISYRRLNFMCLMLTILFTIFDITWFFRALSEMQDTESIEELKRLVYSKMLKEIKTTVVFKDTKRAKKTTGVFQDIHESKDYKQLL